MAKRLEMDRRTGIDAPFKPGEDEYLSMLQLQRRIGDWAEATFPGHTLAQIVLHLLRESIELCMASGCTDDEVMLSVAKEITDASNFTKKPPLEAADMAILLLTLANHSGFSLSMAIADKHNVNLARTWAPPDFQGIREHADIVVPPHPAPLEEEDVAE